MTLNLSLKTIAGWLRQLGSLASIVIGALGTGGEPTWVRAVLIAGGAGIQWIEHHNAGKVLQAALPPAADKALLEVLDGASHAIAGLSAGLTPAPATHPVTTTTLTAPAAPAAPATASVTTA